VLSGLFTLPIQGNYHCTFAFLSIRDGERNDERDRDFAWFFSFFHYSFKLESERVHLLGERLKVAFVEKL
jgi:hypothetical protein